MSKLTDLESRLRFLTAGQLEMALTGMYPTVEVLPFGSSVNGFGKMGCDLDVVLTLDNMKVKCRKRSFMKLIVHSAQLYSFLIFIIHKNTFPSLFFANN